jgi:riboflavin synthase
MFTGIVEELGRVEHVLPLANGRALRIAAARVLEGMRTGDSIAVDGVCLTAVRHDAAGFEVEAIGTTLSRSTVGALEPGDEVNLERALALGERLGGHLVQGHVDGLGTVRAIRREGEHVLLDVTLPEDVAAVTTLHGSIAIQGVSLTVNALPADGVAQVALIPYTWEHTNLRHLQVGDRVNLEGDMIGKFVAHLVAQRGAGGAHEETVEK